jgi:hypothetical protein
VIGVGVVVVTNGSEARDWFQIRGPGKSSGYGENPSLHAALVEPRQAAHPARPPPPKAGEYPKNPENRATGADHSLRGFIPRFSGSIMPIRTPRTGQRWRPGSESRVGVGARNTWGPAKWQ